ncbi:MAG: hypothetical protein ACTSYO_08160 [Candidatus Ranarchaeia archaeon]
MNDQFEQYYTEKLSMISKDYVQALTISAGAVIFSLMIIIGFFVVPIPFLIEWFWVAAGSSLLMVLPLITYLRKHWKYSSFGRWKKSQRRK